MGAIGVDIGGRGVRLGRESVDRRSGRHELRGELARPTIDSIGALVGAMRQFGRSEYVGVSDAGFAKSGGDVTTSRAQLWTEGPLRTTLPRELGAAVAVVHDVETHLVASIGGLAPARHPALVIAAGSSVAAAVVGKDVTQTPMLR